MERIKESIAWLKPFDEQIELTLDHVRSVNRLLDLAQKVVDGEYVKKSEAANHCPICNEYKPIN